MEQNITIRRAARTDCPRMMELIKELAVYEKYNASFDPEWINCLIDF